MIDNNDNPTLFSAGPAVASDGTLTFTPAANKNGVANITLYVQDNGGTANGGDDTSGPQTFVITVNAINDAPLAIAQSYAAQANMQIVGLTGLLTGATDPDASDPGFTSQLQVGSVSGTTPSGGTVTLTNAGTGTFSFDPPPGASGNVTFTYTVCDNGNPMPNACSAPATVTVNVAGPVIWFVDAAVAGPGTGTLADPFKTAAAADAVDAANQRIFLYSGSYANGITLNTGEWLIGQGVTGVSFDAIFGITPAAGTIARPRIGGTRPIVQGTVVPTSSAVVRGLNIQPAAGTQGLTGSSAAGLTVGEVSVTTLECHCRQPVQPRRHERRFLPFTAINAQRRDPRAASCSTTHNASFRQFYRHGHGRRGSGGTIQNMTDSGDPGRPVARANISPVVHEHPQVTATPWNEGGIRMMGATGTNSLTSSTVSGGYEDQHLRAEYLGLPFEPPPSRVRHLLDHEQRCERGQPPVSPHPCLLSARDRQHDRGGQ